MATVVSVDLRQRQVDNAVLSALASSNDLRYLNLSHTDVVDLSFLAKLTRLEGLDLSGTKVTDLSPLSHLKVLTTLNVVGNTSRIRYCSGELSDLSGLRAHR